jgi:hypothetical protein
MVAELGGGITGGGAACGGAIGIGFVVVCEVPGGEGE